jgi:hypothetical protein
VQKFTNQLAKGGYGWNPVQWQFSHEMAQDAVAPRVADSCVRTRLYHPAVDVMEEWDRLKAAAPDTAGVMLVYTLLGTGRARWNDAKAERQYLANKDFILAAATPSRWPSRWWRKTAQEATTAEDKREAIKGTCSATISEYASDMTTPRWRKRRRRRLPKQAQAVDLSHQPKAEWNTSRRHGRLNRAGRMMGPLELVDAGGTVVAESRSKPSRRLRSHSATGEAVEGPARGRIAAYGACPAVPPAGKPTPTPQHLPRSAVRLVQEEIDQLRTVFPEMALKTCRLLSGVRLLAGWRRRSSRTAQGRRK